MLFNKLYSHECSAIWSYYSVVRLNFSIVSAIKPFKQKSNLDKLLLKNNKELFYK